MTMPINVYSSNDLEIFVEKNLPEWNKQHEDEILNLRSINLSDKKIPKTDVKYPLQFELSFVDLSGAKLTNIEFRDIVFQYSSFEKATLCNVKFSNCKFKESSFCDSTMTNTVFIENSSFELTSFIQASFTTCQLPQALHQVDFAKATFQNSLFKKSQMRNINFRESIFDNSELSITTNHTNQGVDFSKSKFHDCALKECKIIQSSFDDASFSGTTIHSSKFTDVSFKNTNLQDIVIDHETTFKTSNFNGAKIDKYSLECISDTQIPVHSRVTMAIVDDIEKLRLLYSGFYQYLNTFLLFLFAWPYMWFIYKQYVIAKFAPINQDETITMLGALCRFIVSGGTSWQIGWIIDWGLLAVFSFALIYNLLRLVLLIKTLNLEHENRVKGLPIKFSLDQTRWGVIFKISNYLFWINLLAVLVHTIHFLSQRVPIGVG